MLFFSKLRKRSVSKIQLTQKSGLHLIFGFIGGLILSIFINSTNGFSNSGKECSEQFIQEYSKNYPDFNTKKVEIAQKCMTFWDRAQQTQTKNPKAPILINTNLPPYSAGLTCNEMLFLYVVSWFSNYKSHEERCIRYDSLSDILATQFPRIRTQDLTVHSSVDSFQIPVRTYQPSVSNNSFSNNKGIILFIHGGGWSRGSLNSHDVFCKLVCDQIGVPVIAVGYRLAPDYVYPTQLNDVYDTYMSLVKQYGGTHSIYVMGDSAGGQLASTLVHRLIEKKEQLPTKLVLIYPVVDLRPIPLTDMRPYKDGPFLTIDLLNMLYKNYLKDENPSNPECSVILSKNLNLFPSTTIICAEHDILTQEGKLFSQKLKHATYYEVSNAVHTFIQYPDLFKEQIDEFFSYLIPILK